MTKRPYVPVTLNTEFGQRISLVSHVIKEVTGVLGVSLKHAATRHARTVGLLARSHASIKQAKKIETGERRSLRRNYVSFAVLIYNTFYHTSIGCEPSRGFYGRIPHSILDFLLGILPQQAPIPTLQFAEDVLDQTEMIFQFFRRSAMQAYISFKAYYDKEANTSKPKEPN